MLAGALVALTVLAHPAASGPTHPEPEPWVTTNVSPSGLVLYIQAVGGGCGGDVTAVAHESATQVRIDVAQQVPDSAEICPALARIDSLRVRLQAPIAGRALVKQSLRSATPYPHAFTRAPRMVGLRVADARYALRAMGFDARGARSGRVRAQSPRPRTPVARGAAVTLRTHR